MCGASEIATYAMAKGITENNLTDMSNAIASLHNSGDAVLSIKKAVIKMGSVNDCVTVEIRTGADDDNLTVSFGAAGGDGDCLSLQSLIDAEKYPMVLRGHHVVY